MVSFPKFILFKKNHETLQQWSIDKVFHWNDTYQIIVQENINACPVAICVTHLITSKVFLIHEPVFLVAQYSFMQECNFQNLLSITHLKKSFLFAT